MRIAIVDDNVNETAQLVSFLERQLDEKSEWFCFPDGESFLLAWNPHDFDIIILDIYMKEILGIDVAKEIRKKDAEVCIVFCTTSNEFASESYEVEAGYYLRKPITEEGISLMLRKLNLEALKQTLSVTLSQGQRVLLQDILHTECSGHMITIHRKTDCALRVRMTQKNLEALLCQYPEFVSCSKGVIVNLNEVSCVNEYGFLLYNQTVVPISRRKMKEMKDAYADFLFQKLRKRGY
ncbi:MAG: LytTR family DNA-binding domain-containing protein [Eubacteriales bacterium]|nr:LytTR family DNA-binding domain-containing protein [Eubacteriales bacterium]